MNLTNGENLLISKITKKFPKQYRDDLYNECYIALNDARRTFNPLLSQFDTHAYKWLYFACVKYMKAYQINGISLDESAFDEDNEKTTNKDLIVSDLDLDLEINNNDYISRYTSNLTQIEKFIQEKYYQDLVPVKVIIKVYQPFHLIKDEKTIRKILKKKK